MPLSLKNKILIFCMATVGILLYQNCSNNFKASSSTITEGSNSNAENNQGNDSPESPSPPATPVGKLVNVFMASGHVGRTLFSCDDGKTWIHDLSDDDNTRCWVTGDPKYVECDHTDNAGRGLDSDNGLFFANFGWGYNGTLRSSRDGVHWQVVRSDGWGGGVSFVENQLFLMWRGGVFSDDLGETWQSFVTSPMKDFDHPWLTRMRRKIAMIGRPTGTNKVSISLDAGKTWNLVMQLQSEKWIKNMEEGKDRMVAVGYLEPTGLPVISYSAISLDQGATWTIKEQTGLSANWENLIFDGNQFITWSSGKRWHSPDGLAWTSSNVMIGDKLSNFTGPTAFNPETKTFARILGGWGNNYSKQKAYRSADGIVWEELPSTAFKGGHPIRSLVHGKMDAAYCQGEGS